MARKRKPQKKTPKFSEGWEKRIAKSSPPLVAITWLDACADSGITLEVGPGWQTSYQPRGAVMETSGFLLEATDNWFVLGMERHSERDSGFRRLTHIPVYSVCKLEVLREGVNAE